MSKKRPLCVDVPEYQNVVRLRFLKTNTTVTVESAPTGGITTTTTFSSDANPQSVVIGDLVKVYLDDDDIVPDPESSDSESDSGSPEASTKCAYGVVYRVFDTGVMVIWFYARSEFFRPYPRGYGTKINEYTLSTKVSDEILIDSIEKIEKVPDMSDCVFCVEDNLLKGDAASIMRYYATLALVHTRRKETSCSFVAAVDWAITTKQGLFASIGMIKPSNMAATISLFEDTGRARLPDQIGPEIGKIGEFSLPAW